jgi:hypothetical protein
MTNQDDKVDGDENTFDALGVPKWIQPSSNVHRFWWRDTNYERMPDGHWKATPDVGREHLKAARTFSCVDRSDEDYAAEARATAEREAAADPAQALRLRAIDRLIAQREKKPLSPLLAVFVEKAKASLGDTKEYDP